MNSDLCIGIASKNGEFEIAALEHGKTSAVMRFPATGMGIEAIRGFLRYIFITPFKGKLSHVRSAS